MKNPKEMNEWELLDEIGVGLTYALKEIQSGHLPINLLLGIKDLINQLKSKMIENKRSSNNKLS